MNESTYGLHLIFGRESSKTQFTHTLLANPWHIHLWNHWPLQSDTAGGLQQWATPTMAFAGIWKPLALLLCDCWLPLLPAPSACFSACPWPCFALPCRAGVSGEARMWGEVLEASKGTLYRYTRLSCYTWKINRVAALKRIIFLARIILSLI